LKEGTDAIDFAVILGHPNSADYLDWAFQPLLAQVAPTEFVSSPDRQEPESIKQVVEWTSLAQLASHPRHGG
jgi:hypothetical protein